MSTSVTFNGTSYTVPAIADASWGTNVSNYLIAIASGCLQKTGGSFTLSTADVNFGATYGLKSVYFKSVTTNIAAAGVVQLAKTDVMSWRNNANGADLPLGIDGSDNLTFNSIILVNSSGSQTLTNKLLSDSTVKFANVSDATKLLMFSLGGATTGKTMTFISSHTNNRSITFPDVTDTLVGLATTDTLTNKTLTSPVLTTPTLGVATATSINKMAITAPATSSTLAVADGKTFTASNTLTFTGTDTNSFAFPSGSSTVMTLASADTITGIKSFNDGKAVLNGSSSGAMTLKAPAAASTYIATFFAGTDTVVGLTFQQTMTNKLLSDSTIKFANVSDATKLLLFSLGGATTGQAMTLISSHTTARSLTFPDATDTLVGKATTDTLTNKTATALNITGGSYVNYLAQAAARYNDSSTNYVALKAPSSVTTYTVTWPAAVPSANQVLADAGAGDGVMAWVSAASSSLNQYNQDIGNASNARTGTNTNLLGDIKAQTRSQTATVTIASPGVFTSNSHGMANGEKFYLTTSGALPTGLTASTTYYASNIATNTFNASTTYANAVAGTYINTSGSQSGTHTLFMGGLALTSGVKGVSDTSSATAGYIDERIVSVNSAGGSFAVNTWTNITSIALTPGDWDVAGQVRIQTFSVTAGLYVAGVTSAYSGATTTDHVDGDNVMQGPNPTVGNADTSLTISAWRVSTASAATIYLKAYVGATSGTSYGLGRISARRCTPK